MGCGLPWRRQSPATHSPRFGVVGRVLRGIRRGRWRRGSRVPPDAGPQACGYRPPGIPGRAPHPAGSRADGRVPRLASALRAGDPFRQWPANLRRVERRLRQDLEGDVMTAAQDMVTRHWGTGMVISEIALGGIIDDARACDVSLDGPCFERIPANSVI